ncbi:hypothetical protein ONZ45_g10773 [Pleurotus djamor]|nr:hypothetical protein ONZ45_g10773 [Pleurotus djamor]
MPELAELTNMFYLVDAWLAKQYEHRLQAFYADATDAEASHPRACRRAQRGLPFRLKAKGRVPMYRGTTNQQEELRPQCLLQALEEGSHIKLVEQVYHARNLVFRFAGTGIDDVWMQVQTLTHTMLQILTHEQWITQVFNVPKTERKFKVGLAVDLGTYVFMFATHDMVFKVSYARNLTSLPAVFGVDIYFDFKKAVACIAAWMRGRLRQSRHLPAVTVIRDASHVFIGMGVYTAHEIFHRAGLAVDYTELEVIWVPSRNGRLVQAFYSHAHIWHSIGIRFIAPYTDIKNDSFVVSCRKDQRDDYSKKVAVHGQDLTSVSKRLQEQVFARQAQLQSERYRHTTYLAEQPSKSGKKQPFALRYTGVDDAFEPSLIKEGLYRDENVGDLILGKDNWHNMGFTVWPDHDIRKVFEDVEASRITAFFTLDNTSTHPYVALDNPATTFLSPIFFDPNTPFILAHQALTRCKVPTTLTILRGGKPAWSIYPTNVPLMSDDEAAEYDDTDDKEPVVKGHRIATQDLRNRRLLSKIAYSDTHAIGPLDYCATALKYRHG